MKLFLHIVSIFLYITTHAQETKIPITATVRNGSSLCGDEIKALYRRFEIVKKKICYVINKQLTNDHIPFIGIAGSGGGHRAMICTLGLLAGLEQAGLLDTIMYQAGVSGSTWTIASWLAQNFPLTNLRVFLRDRVTDDSGIKAYDIKAIASVLYNKFKNGQSITLGDVWGGLVANTFLAGLPNSGLNVYMSELASLVKTGRFPLPLFTAVRDHSNPYEWFEFTPFECGSIDQKIWIQTSAMGKKFDGGVSYDQSQEERLGFLLGICSSAYAANVKEMIREVLARLAALFANDTTNKALPNPFSLLINELLDLQISPPKIYNFAKNISRISYASKNHLTLIDAGCDFNLPFPPLLRRNINLYIVCDASNNATIGTKYHALHGVQTYAQRNSYKFPKIDYGSIGNEVSVFYDPNDPEVPTIIYFPNQLAFSTFKPNYTRDEFNQLYSTMKDTVLKYQDLITAHISRIINNLQSRTR